MLGQVSELKEGTGVKEKPHLWEEGRLGKVGVEGRVCGGEV